MFFVSGFLSIGINSSVKYIVSSGIRNFRVTKIFHYSRCFLYHSHIRIDTVLPICQPFQSVVLLALLFICNAFLSCVSGWLVCVFLLEILRVICGCLFTFYVFLDDYVSCSWWRVGKIISVRKDIVF